jgi:hypothetical protein
MRLSSISFMTRNDIELKFTNYEDWVINVTVRGEDRGIIICPQSSRVTVAHPERTFNLFAEILAERALMFTEVEWSEKEYLVQDLVDILPFF